MPAKLIVPFAFKQYDAESQCKALRKAQTAVKSLAKLFRAHRNHGHPWLRDGPTSVYIGSTLHSEPEVRNTVVLQLDREQFDIFWAHRGKKLPLVYYREPTAPTYPEVDAEAWWWVEVVLRTGVVVTGPQKKPQPLSFVDGGSS